MSVPYSLVTKSNIVMKIDTVYEKKIIHHVPAALKYYPIILLICEIYSYYMSFSVTVLTIIL